ncbi:MAG TPA: NUDIX domain-containing protein [Candidatus Paceibacterota bacterium]|nr:NUDIX domain-containing protein [Candidatus Paceibacterota bacterium]
MENKKLFKVIVTAIVVKEGKYLVLQRAEWEKKFPLRWTVPGGKVSTDDYVHSPKDTPDYWYNVLENVLRREVKEEAGIEIKNIRYVTSLADAREGDDPSIVISCLADWASGEVVLDKSMVSYKWVSLAESKVVDLIEGIYEELSMAEDVLQGKTMGEWGKK